MPGSTYCTTNILQTDAHYGVAVDCWQRMASAGAQTLEWLLLAAALDCSWCIYRADTLLPVAGALILQLGGPLKALHCRIWRRYRTLDLISDPMYAPPNSSMAPET